jgi:hypothetical protein
MMIGVGNGVDGGVDAVDRVDVVDSPIAPLQPCHRPIVLVLVLVLWSYSSYVLVPVLSVL